MAHERADSQAMMEYDARKRSALLAYLLWFFLGWSGAHRMYSARVPSGIAQFLIHGIGWLTTPILIGWAFIAIWAIWWVVDAFLIPGWIRNYNLEVARSLSFPSGAL